MISEVIRSYRMHKEITVRELAKVIGLSAATVSRIEHGKPVDQTSMMKLLTWLFKTK